MSRDKLIKGRTSLKNHIYHVTTCTQNRQPFFDNFHCARLLINEMKKLEQSKQVLAITWVIMPDHLHWLLQLSCEKSLSTIMQSLKGCSSKTINQYNPKINFSWQRGFYDHAIRAEEDLLKVSRYIVANPLRAGLVDNIGHYPFWDSIYI
ncbi:transposase [Colwellia sp. MT41]|uniref:REP-associated tyrosine transposase n=1 Tax=Colwellia sp. MT41 TaxID=58049 RepID=UPI0007179444|nr:transposase [Colwellia sp. MT41]ALO34269.1 transposase [Colwellia sp. MT41]